MPYPPTLNHYYLRRGNKTFISFKGQAFRQQVCSTLAAARIKPMAGMLAVKIRAYPPDRRKRDIDNIQKPLLDALEKGKAFYNDCQIKLLVTIMKHPVRGGKTVVTIRSFRNGT